MSLPQATAVGPELPAALPLPPESSTLSGASSPETRQAACHECDLLLDDCDFPGQAGCVVCPRCGAELYRLARDPQAHLDSLAALTSTALILLLLANLFPIVGLNLQGHRIETTVFGAAEQLWRDDMPIIAALLLTTTVLTPLLELGALAWLVWHLRHARRPAGFVMLCHVLQLVQPWAMVEVFILGVLVSLVKLSHLADIVLGPAIACFAALMLVLAALATRVDARALWQAWAAAGSGGMRGAA